MRSSDADEDEGLGGIRAAASQRQRRLAERIGRDLYDGWLLRPFGAHGSFGVVHPDELVRQSTAQFALALVAWRLYPPERHLVDHAWVIGVDRLPVGFVAEPYLDGEDDAEAVCRVARRRASSWGLGVSVCRLPASASAWNPGRCTPIVVLMPRDGRATFLANLRRERQGDLWSWRTFGPVPRPDSPVSPPIPRRR
jgi:hypothetical protein